MYVKYSKTPELNRYDSTFYQTATNIETTLFRIPFPPPISLKDDFSEFMTLYLV